MSDLWLVGLAADFWERCGIDEESVPFPRDLAEPVLWGQLSLDIEQVAGLHLLHVADYAHAVGLAVDMAGVDRPLRACILAWRGRGLILVDAADPAEEQRFSLAHEIAHFLYEYEHPRRACISRMGDTLRAVLDGERPASADERAQALLAGVTIGIHTHFMEREADGTVAHPAIDSAEQRADALALQLLAPADLAWAAISQDPAWPRMYEDARHQHAAIILWEAFGLPRSIARRYAAELLTRFQPAPSVGEWLGL